jgi:hypothetical protein
MLIDKIVRPGAIVNASELDMPLISRWFRSSYVLLATNVAEMIMAMNEGEFDVHRDLPNVAPSFENMFIEFSLRDRFTQNQPRHYALIINSCDRVEHPDADCWTREFGGLDTRWSCNAFLFQFTDNKEQAAYIGHMFWGVLPNGEFSQHHQIESEAPQIKVGGLVEGMSCTPSNLAFTGYQNMFGLPPEKIAKDIFHLAKVPLMSLCFLHAKNVTIQKSAPPTPHQAKAWRKKNKPFFRYHTITIDQRHTRVVGGGGAHGTHGSPAVHICRGHFKRFTAEKPLLGKHVGVYWWPMMLRGSKEQGVVVKDYAIKPPGESGN